MNYTENDLAKDLENSEYKFGFTTDIESDKAPAGLNENIIRLISSKKNEPEWLLEYRLNALQKTGFPGNFLLRSAEADEKIRKLGRCGA